MTCWVTILMMKMNDHHLSVEYLHHRTYGSDRQIDTPNCTPRKKKPGREIHLGC